MEVLVTMGLPRTSPSAHGVVDEEQAIPGRRPAVHVPLMQ